MLDKDVDSITFDVFAFKNTVKENELVYMACYLFQKRNLFQYLNISQFTFTKFIKKIQSGYLPNLFHNSIHATDVLQVNKNQRISSIDDLSRLQITSLGQEILLLQLISQTLKLQQCIFQQLSMTMIIRKTTKIILYKLILEEQIMLSRSILAQ